MKHPCFFLGGVSRCGPGRRARWPGLACDSSKVASDIGPIGPSSAFGGSCGLPRGEKYFPLPPPGLSYLVECGVCPSASGPSQGAFASIVDPCFTVLRRGLPIYRWASPLGSGERLRFTGPLQGAIEVESLRLPPDGHTCPGVSRRGLCPPPPSPRAGQAIGAMRSPREDQRHGQGSTGTPCPGDTCRGSAPAPGPRAGRAIGARYAWRPGTGRGSGQIWWRRPR